MVQKKVQKTVDIWKKKRWYKIISPSLFNNEIIGETPSLEQALLPGRTIESNLMELTRDMKKQHIAVTFEIEKVQGDSVYTLFKKYEVVPAFIRKFVRRGRNRIDDAFICTTADGWNFKVKPFLLTRTLTTKSVTTQIRKKAKEFLIRNFARASKEGVIKDIIFGKMQKYLKDDLNRIYPLKSCEIRVLELAGKSEAPPKENIAEIPSEAPEPKPAETAEVKEEAENINQSA